MFVSRKLAVNVVNIHNLEAFIQKQGVVVSQACNYRVLAPHQRRKKAKDRSGWRDCSSRSSWGRSEDTPHSTNYGLLALAGGIAIGGTLYHWNKRRGLVQCQKVPSIQDAPRAQLVESKVTVPSKSEPQPKFGGHVASLPTYRRSEVEKHNSLATGVWVTYKHGIYDVTEFAQEGHPGGSKILLAAGKGLEAFFNVYAVHKSEHVMEIMETLRIGNMHADDMKEDSDVDVNDPFASDPVRSPILRVNSKKPFNAEPPPEMLLDSYNTPNELFFVRNHLPVPKIDSSSFTLEVTGQGLGRPIKYSVNEMKKKFPVHTISAAVQCAGNRRSNMASLKSVRGLSWGTTAISNATWTGVKLSDVLAAAGVREEEVEHVHLQGGDKDIEGVPYEASIPASTAFDPRKDVLLAFEMNGEALPLDHGYPIRVIVPGVVGARNVKWLRKIVLSKKESESHWQQNDYKSFNPSVDWSNVDYSKSVAIQEYPIQSAICEPGPGVTIDNSDEVTFKGYAWSGGGRGIIRVDVSIDGGKTWQCAELTKEKQRLHREWAWTIWEATVPIPPEMQGQQLELVCKAVDTSHNVQPDSIDGIWNLRGLIHNAWHRVKVKVPRE